MEKDIKYDEDRELISDEVPNGGPSDDLIAGKGKDERPKEEDPKTEQERQRQRKERYLDLAGRRNNLSLKAYQMCILLGIAGSIFLGLVIFGPKNPQNIGSILFFMSIGLLFFILIGVMIRITKRELDDINRQMKRV